MTKNFRILAEGQMRNNNTWETGLCNNDVIIGPSGSGKTRSYVKPNILQCNESMIITDTKGSLRREVGGVLKRAGYKIVDLDFTDCAHSIGYNPLDYIGYDSGTDTYCGQDIMKMAACIVPVEDFNNPFWEKAARMYLEAIIAYVLECLPREEHTMSSVGRLFMEMGTPVFDRLFAELGELNPNSFAVTRYRMQKGAAAADRMYASIVGILAEKLSTIAFGVADGMFCNPEAIDIEDLRRRKTAVFLTISDTDRSMDGLASLFYTQAFQLLCSDGCSMAPPEEELPVRIILDDFAANVVIPDFDRIISVIRSRDIYVSIILQSLSQLEAMYGHARALTILNNCDNCLYLGGQDVETAQYIGQKADKSVHAVLNMPLSDALLFTRGEEPRQVKKYSLERHERYRELPEALQWEDVPFPEDWEERYGVD